MPATYTLTGLNLRTYPLGEHDKLVVVFSRERGIVRLAARGARKTGNRWAGRLEPLARNALQVSRGRGSIEVLTTADTRVSGAALMGDLDRVMTGLRLAEVTRALLPEHEPNPDVFDAFEKALDLLMERVSPAIVGLWYELLILDAAGYRPGLDACVSCESPLDFGAPAIAFAFAAGGARCSRCAISARPVSTLSMRLLRALQDAQPEHLRGAEAPPEIAADASAILAEVISRNAQAELHAVDLMRKLSL